MAAHLSRLMSSFKSDVYNPVITDLAIEDNTRAARASPNVSVSAASTTACVIDLLRQAGLPATPDVPSDVLTQPGNNEIGASGVDEVWEPEGRSGELKSMKSAKSDKPTKWGRCW